MHRVLHVFCVYSFFLSISLWEKQPDFGPHVHCSLGLITFPFSSLLFISHLFFVPPALSISNQSYLQNATKIISFLQHTSPPPVSWGCCCCCTAFVLTVTWIVHLLKCTFHPQGPRGCQSIDPWPKPIRGPAVQEAVYLMMSFNAFITKHTHTHIQAIDCELGSTSRTIKMALSFLIFPAVCNWNNIRWFKTWLIFWSLRLNLISTLNPRGTLLHIYLKHHPPNTHTDTQFLNKTACNKAEQRLWRNASL